MLDQQLDTFIAKSKAAVSPDRSWVWKILGAVTLVIGALYIRYLLAQRSKELAAAKTALYLNRLDAENAVIQSQVTIITGNRAALEKQLANRLSGIAFAEAALKMEADKHATQVAKVTAVQANDWDALNKLAGVAP